MRRRSINSLIAVLVVSLATCVGYVLSQRVAYHCCKPKETIVVRDLSSYEEIVYAIQNKSLEWIHKSRLVRSTMNVSIIDQEAIGGGGKYERRWTVSIQGTKFNDRDVKTFTEHVNLWLEEQTTNMLIDPSLIVEKSIELKNRDKDFIVQFTVKLK